MKRNHLLLGSFLVALAVVGSNRILAATLNVDPARSQITLSGDVAGFTLREQAAGSLTTTVSGTVDMSVAEGNIQINSANLDPAVNGSWAPGIGSEATSPADFGGQSSSFLGNITGALRKLLVDMNSPSKPLSGGGQFDASAITFVFPAGAGSVLDYNAGFLGKGSKELDGAGTNQTATVGIWVENNGVGTLTINLDATFHFSLIQNNDTKLRLQGQLVASGTPSAAPPQISAVEVVNGQLQITAESTSNNTRLQGTGTFATWQDQSASVAVVSGSTRTFTVSATDRFRFFRLAE